MRYEEVPKTLEANLEFRSELDRRCREDKNRAEAVWALCRQDILFWLNVFCFTYDPRKVEAGENPLVPWITWPFQDEFVKVGEECLGKQDLCVVKSRCMGATWLILALFTHRWQFFENLSFGMVSREERLVDGHPRSMFTKIDFLLEKQPRWLVGRYEHFHMRFKHLDTKSTMEGATTGPDVFRGDRHTATMHDEFSSRELADGEGEDKSSFAATRSRFFNSTPMGSAGAFHRIAHNPAIKRYDIHWPSHPEYSQGLSFKGEPSSFGKVTYQKGKPTSPWYEGECRRLNSLAAIAAELDLDFGGSGKPYFSPATVQAHRELHGRPPFLKGRLEYAIPGKDDTIRFVPDPDGWLSLWVYLTPEGRAPLDPYGAGADIATGQGATPSVMSVANKRLREKVAEAATAHMDPKEFALACKMVCWLFHEPFFVWELQGPGVPFGKQLIDLGYRHVYFRQDELGLTRKVQANLTPGWVPTPNNKNLVLGNYREDLASQMFVNHSEKALDECALYVYNQQGQVENHLIRTDDSDARQNHGDRVIADALCCKAIGPPDKEQEREYLPDESSPFTEVKNPPPHSFHWLMNQWRNEQQRKSDWESSPESLRGWDDHPSSLEGWG